VLRNYLRKDKQKKGPITEATILLQFWVNKKITPISFRIVVLKLSIEVESDFNRWLILENRLTIHADK
jgi:hypothetical protein